MTTVISAGIEELESQQPVTLARKKLGAACYRLHLLPKHQQICPEVLTSAVVGDDTPPYFYLQHLPVCIPLVTPPRPEHDAQASTKAGSSSSKKNHRCHTHNSSEARTHHITPTDLPADTVHGFVRADGVVSPRHPSGSCPDTRPHARRHRRWPRSCLRTPRAPCGGSGCCCSSSQLVLLCL